MLLRMAAAVCCLLAGVGVVESVQLPPRPVSLIQVIANPQAFDGRRIWIIGVADLGPASFLYLGINDYRNLLTANAIRLNPGYGACAPLDGPKPSAMDGKYVLVEGTFRAGDSSGATVGTMVKVTKCVLWSDPTAPKREQIRKMLHHTRKPHFPKSQRRASRNLRRLGRANAIVG